MYSTAILVLLAVIFAAQTLVPGFTQLFWFNPSSVLTQPWGFLTAIFLHGSLLHLFFNGFALLMFGPFLEQKIGSRKFLELFLISGVLGSVFYYLFILAGITPPLPALGASGAIYGILGALAILTPNLMILVWFIPMNMRQAAVFWVILELFGTFNPASGIASAAHLGGLVVGAAYAKYFFKPQREAW
jgi:hypothetical protein